MNAIELLKSDHDRVDQLFEKYDQAGDLAQKRQIFEEIRDALERHTHTEETVFYPRFKDRPGFEDLIEDSYSEHQEVKTLLMDLPRLESEEDFDDTMNDLIEAVDQHVEEEEHELFPKVEDLLSEDELAELGEELEAAKGSLPGARAA